MTGQRAVTRRAIGLTETDPTPIERLRELRARGWATDKLVEWGTLTDLLDALLDHLDAPEPVEPEPRFTVLVEDLREGLRVERIDNYRQHGTVLRSDPHNNMAFVRWMAPEKCDVWTSLDVLRLVEPA